MLPLLHHAGGVQPPEDFMLENTVADAITKLAGEIAALRGQLLATQALAVQLALVISPEDRAQIAEKFRGQPEFFVTGVASASERERQGFKEVADEISRYIDPTSPEST
jgi:hypothetical protein